MPKKVESHTNESDSTSVEDAENGEEIENRRVYTRREFLKVWGIGAATTLLGFGGGFLLGRQERKSRKSPAYRMPGREEKLPVEEIKVVTGRKINCNNFSSGSHVIIQTEYDVTGDGRPDAVEVHLYSDRLDIRREDFEKMAKRLKGAKSIGLTEQPVDSKLPIGDPNRRKGSYPTLLSKEPGEYVIKTLFRGVTIYK